MSIENTQTMTFERAGKIRDALFDISFFSMGIGEREDKASAAARTLDNVSLSDMIEALRFYKEHSDLNQPEAGVRQVAMTIDDRMVAAIYTLLHWKHGMNTSAEDDDCIVKIEDGRITHFLIVGGRWTSDIRAAEEKEAAEDEEAA